MGATTTTRRAAVRPTPGGAPPLAQPRQRWRVAYRRRADAPPLDQRETAAAWEEALALSGLVAPAEGSAGGAASASRRLSFGVSLPAGMEAERDLVDVFLPVPHPITEVRDALARSLPRGHEIVDLHDVWVGAPALPSVIVAATYRIILAGAVGDPSAADLRGAASSLLTSSSLPRTRTKGVGVVAYDLRPFLEAIEIDEGARAAVVRVRVRVDPERGMGRPEEVLAALGDALGRELAAASIVRERVITREDLHDTAR